MAGSPYVGLGGGLAGLWNLPTSEPSLLAHRGSASLAEMAGATEGCFLSECTV